MGDCGSLNRLTISAKKDTDSNNHIIETDYEEQVKIDKKNKQIKKKLEKSQLIDHLVDLFQAREAIDMKRKLGQQGKKK